MKNRKAAVIGLGHVGAHVTNSLALQGIADEILLIDQDEDKVISENQDLNDSLLYIPHAPKIHPAEFEDLKDVDVIINCVGNIKMLNGNNNRDTEMTFNLKAVDSYADKIKESGFNGVIINISNPCDVITRYLALKTGLPKGRVFGTGTALDSSRLISALSKYTGVAEESITAYMLGEHGNKQFSPKSVLSFHGAPLEALGEDHPLPEWKDLEEEAIGGGWVTFSRKHCTEYGIANTAARLAKAVFEDENVVLPVSFELDGEYGQKGCFAGIPCIIGTNGVKKVLELSLEKEELETLEACCDGIRKNIARAEEIEADFAKK